MKAKKRAYDVKVSCVEVPKLRSSFRIINSRSDRAGMKACAAFFEQFPQVLERGLSIGVKAIAIAK